MNIFERLARTRPAEPTTNQPPKDPAQLLLDWLLRQNRSTITLRQLRIHAPRAVRNRDSALKATDLLVQQGWLVPFSSKTRQNRPYEWHVVRHPVISPVVAENVAENI